MRVLSQFRHLRVFLLVAGFLLFASCAVEVEGDLRAAVTGAAPGSTLRVPPGTHAGPVVIDKPLTLVGTEGAWVVGEEGGLGIVVQNTEDVHVRNLGVRGGETGILVGSSERVRLSDVTVENTHRWGILVREAHAEVRGCSDPSSWPLPTSRYGSTRTWPLAHRPASIPCPADGGNQDQARPCRASSLQSRCSSGARRVLKPAPSSTAGRGRGLRRGSA